jgi:NDP-sugar pyrophosphorylase family protein
MSEIAKYVSPDVAKYQKVEGISHEDIEKFKKNTQVVLMAGGLGSRFAEIEGVGEINKLAYKLPTGDTIIETTIKMFKDAGLKDFVCLVYHKSESIQDVLGDGSKLGVNIKYSIDPGPFGKGGAVLNAVLNGTIDTNKSIIMSNPDDIILDLPTFVDDIIKAHIYLEKHNHTITTLINSSGFQVSPTLMVVKDSIVQSSEKECILPIPTHMGTIILSTKTYPHIKKIFDLNKKHHFENELFPYLLKEKLLGATQIPYECWYPVNDLKSLNRLLEKLKSN